MGAHGIADRKGVRVRSWSCPEPAELSPLLKRRARRACKGRAAIQRQGLRSRGTHRGVAIKIEG